VEQRKEREPKVTREIYGGKLEDIPKPRKRKFPGRTKRKVEVSIESYELVGGRHFYPSIQEEKNPIWDKKEKAWRSPWIDPKGEGKRESSRFDTLEEARAWVRKMLKKFPKETHKVEYEYGPRRPKWLYREGD
jgi:hypothetical protein